MRDMTLAICVWSAVTGAGLLVSPVTSSVAEADLVMIRGGANEGPCFTSVLDPEADSHCTYCSVSQAEYWRGCDSHSVSKCVASGTTIGYQPVCTKVVSSCGGYQIRKQNNECNLNASPTQYRPCPRTYQTAIGTSQAGSCP
jgi:hypothetical protein